MSFDPNLKQGQILSNDEICDIFKCGPQGGMRRSLKTNTLVIVSDYTKSIYEDRWENNIFHYTGMGLTGDQSLDFAQNKTLYESDTNNVDVFLFEVFRRREYVYQGRIKLAKDPKPYQEQQTDIDGNLRDVWIFPLKLIDQSPAVISEEEFQKKITYREKQAKKLSLDELRKKIRTTHLKPGTRKVISKQYDRNQDVVEFVKRKANGICQLCNSPAPFKNKDDEPYLEMHHITPLSEGGDDTVSNAVALCPNCHRKMHVLGLDEDKTYLRKQASVDN